MQAKLKMVGIIDGGQKNRVIYENLAREMSDRGITAFSGEQLWKKILYYCKKYRDCKDKRQISGNPRYTFTYFNQIDEFAEAPAL